MAIRRIRRLKSERLTKPNILSFIAYTLILFFGVTILVNINPNANESYRNKRDEKNTQVMQWIFSYTFWGDSYWRTFRTASSRLSSSKV